MPRHAISPAALVRSTWKHRELILQLTRKDVIGRYKGSLFGLAWSYISPLFMLGIYTLFFTEIFHARWGATDTGKGQYATALFAGLIVHAMFGECITRGSQLVTDNANYVTKVIFPLEILPWVSSLTSMYHALASLVILAAFSLIFNGHIAATFLLFPLVFLPLILIATAAGWLLASLGVYVRDVGQMTSLIVIALLYTAPVFFPMDHLSPKMQAVMHFNPLTFLIVQAREVLLWGHLPDWSGLALYTAGALLACWLTYAWFQRTRAGFIDVL
ncbi:sugar ABC transporter permease [Rhodanobacter sp. B04]|uniref:ABC transporter permease n=1 Tax=Rhodanobacter sp. B04 TaxID=1945860 RepID=UPI0009863DE4|nr:ABC transporter permease [Rhodanobacter sp. B04]OOG66468.1 sugar ABC transporter permease [Rhodanobacter sp. B04]